MKKLTSRKFWLTVAMLLGAVATAIAGLSIDNEIITIVGVICGAFAGCVYTICESMVDATYAFDEGVLIEEEEEESCQF